MKNAIIAGIMAASILIAGCGKKSSSTSTPSPEIVKSTNVDGTADLVSYTDDFGGFGLVIMDRESANEPLRTGPVYPGSPAERAGVTPNGLIISVDGTNVESMSLAQYLSIARGPVGTLVTLEIADSKMSVTNKFTLKRSKMFFPRNSIVYID